MPTLNPEQLLPDDELVRLIRTTRERRHRNAPRDHALLCVLANLGIRPGEAVRLTLADLHLEGIRAGTIRELPWIRVRRLKKRAALGSIDDVPVSHVLARVLARYAARARGANGAAVAGARLFPLTVRQVERVFHYYARRAGLGSRFRVYALRHTAATRALEATGDLRAVQVMLGHARITTTQVYAHVRPERRRQLAEKVGGIV